MPATPAAAATLPCITNEDWVLCAANPEQRDELLRYAAERQVPCWGLNELSADTDLDIAWCVDLMVYECIAKDVLRQVSIADFRAMCDAYAAAR